MEIKIVREYANLLLLVWLSLLIIIIITTSTTTIIICIIITMKLMFSSIQDQFLQLLNICPSNKVSLRGCYTF